MKTETTKVLLIDDDEDDYILTRELLSDVKVGNYALDWASSYEEGLKIVARQEHDVCLVDYHLGERTGVQLIREARESRFRMPMILMTGQGTDEVDLEAMQAGAIGYLIKYETPTARLERTLRYAVELNTEHSRAEEALGAYAQKHAVVAEIGRMALTGGDLKDLLADTVILVARTLGVQYCEVLKLLPDGDALLLIAGVGWKEEYGVGQARVSAGEDSQAGFTLLCNEPVVVEDFETETRFSATPLLHEHGVVSGMTVIIRGRERLYGVLGAHTNSKRRFAADDVNFLRSVANVLAEAIGRKRAEDKVSQSEARFRRVINSPMLGILSWNLSGEITEANDAFLKMVGYTSEDAAAGLMRWTEMTPREYRRLDEKALDELAAKGVCEVYEKEYIRKDGSRVPILLGCAMLDGDKHRGVGFVLDISGRKSAEDQLRHARGFSENLLQTANVMIIGLDVDGNINVFNQTAEEITGYTAAEVQGSSWFEKLVPRDRYPHVWDEFLRLIDGGVPKAFENPILTKSGEERYIMWQSNQVRVDGKVVATISFGNDITGRIRAEHELRETVRSKAESLALLDSILSTAPIGFAFHNRDLVYQRINASLAAINGLSVEQHLGKTLREVLPEMSPVLEPLMQRVIDTGKPILDLEINGKTQADSSYPHHWSVSFYPVRMQGGELLGVGVLVSEITERKLAEQALRESEERYRDLVENAHDIIYQHDLKGNYSSTNKAGERITGYSREESLKLNLQQTVAPEYLEKAQQMLSRKLAGEKVTAYDLEIIAKDGHHIVVEVNTTLVLKDGVTVGVQGIARDITERRQAEEALRESEARKRAILESSMDCIISMDHEGQVVDWNPAAEKTFGYSQKDAIGRNMAELIIPERFREHHYRGLARYLATGRGSMIGQRLELSAERSDGTEFPIELTITRTESKGEPIFTGYLRDITERKKAELRLSAQYAVTRALAESNTISEGASKILQAVCESLGWEYGSLWIVDRSANALRCSDIWQATGAEAVEFESASRQSVFNIGVGLPGRVWRDSEPVWIPDLAEDANFPRGPMAALAGLHSGCAFPITFRSEMLGVMEFFSHSVRESDPDLLAMMVTIGSQIGQFIERKRVEAALSESEEQLRQSQKLEAIGQLAGGVAHDFNNLLTVIGGYSSMLLGKLPPESPHRPSIEEIKRAGERAGALTRQLLAFSRKQILQPRVLDLNVVVTDLEKMVRRLIGEDIDLLTITSPVLGKVKADPGQIEQVLLNLIVNARDAMPKGGKLTIETRNVELSKEYALRHAAVAGAYIMLSVSDTGCGMEAAVKPRIFEPFFTTKDTGKGTGLGLATVYGIVKQSGGNIGVYSEAGLGSTFKVWLPRVDTMVETVDEAIPKSVPKGTETVLLVEDEDQVRAIVKEILELQGYHVVAAANGEEALTISQDLKLDINLMITDVVMPQMSGRELAERVVAVRPGLPVLFISGYTDDAIVRHGLLDEKLNFLQKPFDSATVARKVREMLDSELSLTPA
ncbi:MAG: PAS domain S-box protein [Pyrinomonadaceae bacterium]